MVFPIIPIAAIAAIVGGSFTLGWYFSLSPKKREKADKKANKLAKKLFGKPLDELNESEAQQVLEQVEYDHNS